MTENKYEVFHVTPCTRIRLGFVLANSLEEAKERVRARYGNSASMIKASVTAAYSTGLVK